MGHITSFFCSLPGPPCVSRAGGSIIPPENPLWGIAAQHRPLSRLFFSSYPTPTGPTAPNISNSTRVAAWRWCSLWRRSAGAAAAQGLLGNWPVRVPAAWTYGVNQPQNAAEVEAVRRCVTRGRPFGSDAWLARVARDLGLEVTLRPRGRPKNKKKGS